MKTARFELIMGLFFKIQSLPDKSRYRTETNFDIGVILSLPSTIFFSVAGVTSYLVEASWNFSAC